MQFYSKDGSLVDTGVLVMVVGGGGGGLGASAPVQLYTCIACIGGERCIPPKSE